MSGTANVWRLASGVWRLALIATVVCAAAAAEVRLDLPDPLVPGVVMEGGITVQDAPARVRRVELPKVAGVEWEVQAGGMQQTININGKVSSNETVRLAVRVAQAGKYQVPAIKVHFTDGTTLTTAPVTINAQAADAKLDGEAVAEVSFDPDTIVPGQPTVMTYRVLLKEDRLRAIEKPQVEPPANAIRLKEEPDKSSGKTYDAAGTVWQVQTWRWPLTVAQPGTVAVGGQQVWHLCRRGLFGDLESVAANQVAVKPATLTVTALPAEGRPDDFTGLIGQIQVEAKLDRDRIAAGEGVELSLAVRGRQVELLKRPALALPAGLQAYPKEDAAADARNPGERVFRWDVVPAATGDYAIPALSFPWFDPNGSAYRRAASQPLTLVVLPGRARGLDVAGAVPATTPATATAPTVAAGPELPPPWRGRAPAHVPGILAVVALAAGLGLGLVGGLALRLLARRPRGPHRGRRLAAALAGGDLEAVAAALRDLTPALATANQRALAGRLQQAVDDARFGGQSLDQAEAGRLVAKLEDVA